MKAGGNVDLEEKVKEEDVEMEEDEPDYKVIEIP